MARHRVACRGRLAGDQRVPLDLPAGRGSMRGRYHLFAGALLALIAGTAVPAAAQRFADDLAVTAVEVPVQVVRDGEPVRGLTREDFVLLDRGVRRELIDFEVLDVLTVAPGEELGEPAAAPPEVVPSTPAAEPATGRHLLFLFDFQFAPRRRLELAVTAARGMIESGLADHDRVAVAIYTGTAGANVLVGFTRDREEIELGLGYVDALARRRFKDLRSARERLIEYWTRAAGSDQSAEARLRALAARLGSSAAVALSGLTVGGEIMSLAEYDAISGDGEATRGGGVGSPMSDLLGPRLIDDRTTELEDLLSQLLVFGEAMADLATLLRDVPHPKHMVYFSEGFATEILTNAETRERALRRVNRGIRAMQAAGWAIQTIDIEGVPDTLAASGRSAAAFSDPAATTFITGGARGSIRPPTGKAGFDAEALAYLANETGGLLIENFNNLEKAGERILEATAVTYLLVFQPADLKADGSFHPLQVKLASRIPGARILHRPGYVAPTAAARWSETERRMNEARLVTGDQAVLDLAAESLVLSGPRARFVVELAASELLAGRSAGNLELEIQTYVFSPAGAFEDVQSQRLSLDLARVGDRLRQGGLRLSGGLDLSLGQHRIRLVVRDPERERVYARSHPVVNPVDRSRWALPPLFLDPAAEALFLEVRPAGWRDLGLPIGSFVPAAGATLRPGGTQALLFVFFSPPEMPPTVTARIVDAGGEPVAGAEVRWRERLPDAGDGGTRLLGALDAGSLAPGRYRIELSVDDGTGGEPVVVSGPFRVGP